MTPAGRRGRIAAGVVGAAVVTAALLAGLHDVLAQAGPFGVPRPQPPAAPAGPGGLTGWLLAQQAQFYRGLSGAIRAAKADGSAVWGLFGLSFAYGVFHAAGPGHGKAVISSYLVANQETWWRGVVLSFASALLQALTAIALVGIAAVLLNASAKSMGEAVWWIEIVSYALIALIGARLLWVKGRAFLAALRSRKEPASDHDRAHGEAHGHVHHHDHRHGEPQRHGHHHHGHDHDDHHGHAHGPEPDELAGRGGWQRGLSAIVAVGLRPCSGAILVLVFALAQGLFWAGVGATFVMGLGTAMTVAVIATVAVGARDLAARLVAHRGGTGVLVMRGIEVLASVLVLAFGLLLLTGYIASERMPGF